MSRLTPVRKSYLILTIAQAASIVVDNAGDGGTACTLRDAVKSINTALLAIGKASVSCNFY